MLDILPILCSRGLITERDVADIMNEVRTSNVGVDELLYTKGVSKTDILAAKAEHWGIPVRVFGDKDVAYDTLRYIPEESAKHYHVAPLALVDGALEVGIVDPDNLEAIDALNFISAKEKVPFKVFLISEEDYQKALEAYRGVTSEVNMALQQIEGTGGDVGEASDITNIDASRQDVDDLEQTLQEAGKHDKGIEMVEQAPITKIVATILRSAIDVRASDIHIEPEFAHLRVRYRVDGVLNQSLVLPAKVQRSVVARVKVLSGIKLDERRKPQDGRFSATIGGRRVDFRVSTFPTYYGEKAVLRILDSERGKITLEELGMDATQLKTVQRAVQAPYGMILITGPTGSGKSTTLYAMLNEVDRMGNNVLSLEDPVEYNIEGVNQSQVRPEIGYTFAAGIRSILRQDPDIIMVGEIRDKETAQLAVQAALTGHLVLSTLHTNNAAGAVPRLIDMGVDPFLLAPTLNLIVAQRLVRRLCPESGKRIPIDDTLQHMLASQFADMPEAYRSRIPTPKEFFGIEPSTSCPAGTRGRIGVYEMLEVNDDVRKAILTHADEAVVYGIARRHGMLTLKEDTIVKAAQKVVPFEEIAVIGGVQVSEEVSTEQVQADTVSMSEDGGTQGADMQAIEQNGRDLV